MKVHDVYEAIETKKELKRLNRILFFLWVVLSILIIFILVFIPYRFEHYNLQTPSDYIQENQVFVYSNMIVINVSNLSLSRFTPTGSMIPTLNENSNGIKVPVTSESDIHIGDMINYVEEECEDNLCTIPTLIIHRVVDKGVDDKGIYFILKGDNNGYSDGKIRFSQIRSKLIGILY